MNVTSVPLMKNLARIVALFSALIMILALYEPYAPRDSYTAAKNGVYIQNSAQAALLLDATEGRILFSQNASARLPMASTTKIMTAIVAIENMPTDYVVTVAKEAVGIEGSSIYLYAGEQITCLDLLYGLMLESGNDAAVALAIAVGGTEERFIMLMNEKAKELGLKDTRFSNPHGLPAENHFTSAADLARLTDYALQNELFAEIVSTKKMTACEGTRYYVNHNRLLFSYEGMIGVKTGYTQASGRCLVTAARRYGRTLICVTLNDYYCSADHVRMLDSGFSSTD